MLIMKKANCVEKHLIINAEHITNDKQIFIILINVKNGKLKVNF